MKASEFLKELEKGINPIGFYLVPSQYLCMGFVDGTYTLKNWGYYPYIIESIKHSPSGKLSLICRIINKIHPTYKDDNQKKVFEGEKTQNFKFDRYFDFFLNEEDAIQECSLRNRGKMGRSLCMNSDMTKVKPRELKFIADKFY